jgi:threonylcarbamoyladenosine tRNA methylthiotransferase MtaB
MDWSPGLIALFKQYARDDAAPTGPRLARHAHLPLQSGADASLRAMHRRYRPWHYAEKLRIIHDTMPHAAIGADVMVGFPGETEALFEESYRFIEQQPFTYLHLFPFSPRPGTAAWALHRQRPVPVQAIKQRMMRLRSLIDARHAAWRRAAEQRYLSVVTLKSTPEHLRRNRTPALGDNFLHLELEGAFPANQMLWTRVIPRKGPEDGSVATWRAIPV